MLDDAEVLLSSLAWKTAETSSAAVSAVKAAFRLANEAQGAARAAHSASERATCAARLAQVRTTEAREAERAWHVQLVKVHGEKGESWGGPSAERMLKAIETVYDYHNVEFGFTDEFKELWKILDEEKKGRGS